MDRAGFAQIRYGVETAYTIPDANSKRSQKNGGMAEKPKRKGGGQKGPNGDPKGKWKGKKGPDTSTTASAIDFTPPGSLGRRI